MEKVYLIAPSRSQGLQDYTYNLACGLADTEINLTVLVHESYSRNDEKTNVQTTFTDDQFVSIRNLFKELKNGTPDIVHSQSTNLGLLVMLLLLRPLFRYTLILTPHSSKSHWERPIYNRFQPLIYNLFDGIIWHTEQDVERMIDAGVKTPQTVIEHGNYSFYAKQTTNLTQEEARIKLDLPQNRTLFLFFGYIRPDKRFDLLLKAYSRLPSNYQEKAAIIVAGTPTDEKAYNKYIDLIEEAGIKHSVYSWTRFIEDEELPLFFKATDVVVTPYDTISESGVVHIAFAFSKPIIATNTEGFTERLRDKQNGLLIPQGDIQELLDSLIYSIDNKKEMREMGEYNQQQSAQLGWEQIAFETVEFYQEVQ